MPASKPTEPPASSGVRIEPVRFRPAAEAQAAADDAPPAQSSRRAATLKLVSVPLFLFLALAALLYYRTRPAEGELAAQDEPAAVTAPRPRATAQPPPASPPPTAPTPPPPAAAALSQRRAELQALFAELETHAPLWAAAEFESAKQSFERAQQLTLTGDVTPARAQLEATHTQLRALIERAPAVRDAALEEVEQALATANLEAARAPLQVAQAISKDATRVQALAQRVATFPEVLALIEAGAAHERVGEWPAARRAYERATELDPLYPLAAERLEALTARQSRADFDTRLRRGLARLTSGDLARARRELEAALALRPGHAEAQRALQQVESEARAAAFDKLVEAAAQAEAREAWAQALAHYKAALAQDPGLASLREGAARSELRAQLDERLEWFAADRTRLFAPNPLTEVRELLELAARVSPQGPRLEAQTRRVSAHLQVASQRFPVEVNSDGLTEVTALKHGTLGVFTTQRIELRPGVWNFVGTRKGYRDVRRTLTLRPKPGDAPSRVVLRCTEPI